MQSRIPVFQYLLPYTGNCWERNGDVFRMSFFKNEPPKACPKCGNTDSWRCVIDGTPQNHASDAGMGNPFYLDSQRDPFYTAMGNRAGPEKKEKYCYRCDKCGYEKTY